MGDHTDLATRLTARFVEWSRTNVTGMDWQAARDRLPSIIAEWLAAEVPESPLDETELRLIVRMHFKCQGGRMQISFDDIASDLLLGCTN